MNIIYVLLAVIAGATAPTQAGINAELKNVWAGNSVLAALVSFVVGTASIFLYYIITRQPWPPLAALGFTSWWHWSGGVLGAFFVSITVLLAHKLGASTMIALLIAGQMLASIALDHFGLLGYALRPMTMLRVLGAVLIVAGVVLVRRY